MESHQYIVLRHSQKWASVIVSATEGLAKTWGHSGL